MLRLQSIGIVIILSILISGCNQFHVHENIKIQINVPDEPYPGTRTKVISYDIETDRDIFFDLLSSTKKVGMCSPSEIEKNTKSHEIMSISFYGGEISYRKRFVILINNRGQWIDKGFGGLEIYDHPKGFPEYRYSNRVISKLKRWYGENVSRYEQK